MNVSKKTFLYSACPKSPVLDKKSSFSRLTKSGNPKFNNVNEKFSDKCKLDNGVFLPTLYKIFD